MELAKARRRWIVEPHINDITADPADPGTTTTDTARKNTASSESAILFDFAAWFDQLPLDTQVRRFFSFSRRGRKFRMKVLPMGFRVSCLVAQRIAHAIADFPLPPGVTVDIYIDNIRFCGPLALLPAVAEEFRRRAAYVGAILNEADDAPTTEYDFLGEHYSHVQGVRSLTDKTVEKLRLVHEIIRDAAPRCTRSVRSFAAFFGLLFFSSRVLNLDLSLHFHAISFLRSLALAASSSGWDSLVTIDPPAHHDLLSWSAIALSNTPVPIVSIPSGVTDTIICDASSSGWGAVHICGSATRHYSAPWTAADGQMQSSVVAEPLGLVRAACCSLTAASRTVHLFSDHLPLVFAINAGYGRAATYNAAIRRLKDLFPLATFKAFFIAGKDNVTADYLSRQHGVCQNGASQLKTTTNAGYG